MLNHYEQRRRSYKMKKYFVYIPILLIILLLPIFYLFSEEGTAWGPGAFKSNGERIYFTATSERGTRITYKDGFDMGMMMMHGRLACASCHGPDGRGGQHIMHMRFMDSPDIRWSALEKEEEHHEIEESEKHEHKHEGYDLDMFRMAIIEGKHPDGKPLESNMPRWRISEEDLIDLADHLKSLQ
jgi:mono/diheme cytochrome c family protein